ncbi:MAG: 4-(cytidine 5'-diphospho)-2-C-methyl-D-erythritol kinase [Treponema sp.]|nr:4-(cytidine 5'-diphospho)-2-C-methyl-D-erythritol kinase [Treponema sp.]
MSECKALAPAKINLGLEVFPKRADGYHNIKSIFTTVNLFDEITVCENSTEGSCVVECSGMTLPEENTFTKAYKAFCVLTGIKCGVTVKVIKHIPSGGGLGGGSSDASSFIQSIDILFGTHLAPDSLLKIASEVGSDVFFFTQALISNPGKNEFAACVEGRGELIKEIPFRKDLYVLLLLPEVSVSTREAYRLVDQYLENGFYCNKGNKTQNLEAVYGRRIRDWNFVNYFTAPVCNSYPLIKDALKDLSLCGADFYDMSGSGSTLFGVFESEEKRKRAFEKLSEKWRIVFA